jgi:hypothetical protein
MKQERPSNSVNRKRIPEQVVHAKGSGDYGTFTVTPTLPEYTKAKLFSEVGKQTEVFLRFSAVAGEKRAADAERNVWGFAVTFYTEARRQLGLGRQQHASVLHPRPAQACQLYPHAEAASPNQPTGRQHAVGFLVSQSRVAVPNYDFVERSRFAH